MANTLTITREHLDKDNYYIGPDVTNYDGDVVLEPGLGVVKFKTKVSASGSIVAKSGTGIKTDGDIKAGGSIKSSTSIEAGYGIQAGHIVGANGNIKSSTSIKAGENIIAGESIEAGTYLKAGFSIISAGGSIEAKNSIEADGSILAESSIKAGKGIRAGLSIKCKTLTAEFPIFAGTATWLVTATGVIPSKEDTQIRCEKLHGKVAYGELVLSTKEPNLNTTSTSKPISKKKKEEVA